MNKLLEADRLRQLIAHGPALVAEMSLDFRVRLPQFADGDRASESWSAAPFRGWRFYWGREWLSREGDCRRIETLVEELDVSVEAGHLTPESRVGLVGCCGSQGGSFRLEPGPADNGSQLPWCLLRRRGGGQAILSAAAAVKATPSFSVHRPEPARCSRLRVPG